MLLRLRTARGRQTERRKYSTRSCRYEDILRGFGSNIRARWAKMHCIEGDALEGRRLLKVAVTGSHLPRTTPTHRHMARRTGVRTRMWAAAHGVASA